MRDSKTLWMVMGMAFVGFALSAGPVAAQTAQDSPDSETTTEAKVEGVTLRIVNSNFSDVRIYAIHQGRRLRIGFVNSMTSETFDLPSYLQADVANLQLLAVPIGGTQAVLSPVVFPSRGDEVVWGIQNHLALSGTVIR